MVFVDCIGGKKCSSRALCVSFRVFSGTEKLIKILTIVSFAQSEKLERAADLGLA